MKNKFLLLCSIPLMLTVASCAQSDDDSVIKFDYIFTAQPVVSATNSTIFKNVQTDFATKSGGKLLTQASVFIKSSLLDVEEDAKKVESFLSDLKSDITTGIATPSLIKEGIEKAGSVSEQSNKYGVPGAMAMKVTAANNGFSLGFNYASEIKNDISSFVNILTNNQFGSIDDSVFFVSNPERLLEPVSYSDLKILAPTGAPSVALYDFCDNPNFETTTNPSTGLIPQFKTNNYDVIIAPTQGGLTQIVKQNAAYKIAATITYGNFYIVATGHDDNGVLDNGDKVLIFQENDLAGKLFKYTYSDLQLDLTAVAAAADTKTIIENGGILKK